MGNWSLAASVSHTTNVLCGTRCAKLQLPTLIPNFQSLPPKFSRRFLFCDQPVHVGQSLLGRLVVGDALGDFGIALLGLAVTPALHQDVTHLHEE